MPLAHRRPSMASCHLIHALLASKVDTHPACIYDAGSKLLSLASDLTPASGQAPVFLRDRLCASQTNVHSPALALLLSAAALLPEPLSISAWNAALP